MYKKIFASSLLLFIPPFALANQACLLSKTTNQAVVSIAGQYLDYNETESGGAVLDRVRGTQPGLGLQVMKTFSCVYTEISSQFFKGDMEYQGGYYDSDDQFVAASMDTRNSILKLDTKLGYVFLYRPELQLIPYVQLGYRQWERTVPPVYRVNHIGINGYTEEYNNFYYALGGKCIWQAQNNIVIVPRIAIGRTFSPTMYSPTHTPFGITMDGDFHLGTTMYYEAGITGYYFISDLMNINLGLNYDHFGFGRSQTINLPGSTFRVYEPNSYTNELSASLGVGFTFG